MRHYLLPSCFLFLTAVSQAATVTVFSSLPGSYTVLGGVGGAKYRLSNTNWDMSLSGAGGTFAGNFISHGLGNVSALNGLSLLFTLENIAGEGVIYNLSGGSYNKRLAWGTFGTDPCTGFSGGNCIAVTTINSKTVPTNFNALHLALTSTRFVLNTSGSSMSFSGFSSSGLTLSGIPIFSGSVGTDSAGKAAGSLKAQTADRWLVSDMNLASVNWKLSANVAGSRDAGTGDETVRVFTDFKQLAVPEPGAAVYLTTAGAFFLAMNHLRRRNRNALGE